ncbi:MAG: hemerythrin domain-containing protein [Mobilicoccus sp.]|nr:hemerythrin domain-containing protein [Mobilicoccus sp.]
MASQTPSVPRPNSGDIVEVILDDHRLFEAQMRDLRDSSGDRPAALAAFSALMVAHSLAEETQVYPTLKRKTDDVGEHEAEHGEEEHAESLADLLALLEVDEVGSEDFDEAVEKVCNSLFHHLTEEELTILNPARYDLEDETRQKLGSTFLAERNRLLDEDCGTVTYVRREVKKAVKEDLVDADDVPASATP